MQGINFLIDHTNLKANASEYDIEVLTKEAQRLHFNSICIRPEWLKQFSHQYKCSAVIAFPKKVFEIDNIAAAKEEVIKELVSGSSEEHSQEFEQALEDGALEFDPVMNPIYMNGQIPIQENPNFLELKNYIDILIDKGDKILRSNPEHGAKGFYLKPIWSCELLNDYSLQYSVEIMAKALNYYKSKFVNANAIPKINFIYKNSTGFIKIYDYGPQANPELVLKLKNLLDQYNKEKDIQIKVAGGIKDIRQVIELMETAKGKISHIGTSSGVQIAQSLV